MTPINMLPSILTFRKKKQKLHHQKKKTIPPKDIMAEHQFQDSKDSQTLNNRVQHEKEKEKEEDKERAERLHADPTAAAEAHHNKPSRGAIIDKQIQEEEDEILRKKGIDPTAV
jgi:phage protein D